jgi:TrmH family RNA methyltransferase
MLVEPEDSLNIGAVARAMMNLGFRHLHLVAPIHFERERAEITARLAEPLLESVIVHATLADAVGDMEEVVGLSLRPGKAVPRFATLPEWTETLPQTAPRKTALVFGPENNGLRQEHLNLCRWIVRIPSEEAFTAFNLAQSVLLVLYELKRTLPAAARDSSKREPVPTWNQFYQLERLLDAVMQESGFVRPGSPAPVPDVVKALFRRMDPTEQEIGILLALLSRLHTRLSRPSAPDGQ